MRFWKKGCFSVDEVDKKLVLSLMGNGKRFVRQNIRSAAYFLAESVKNVDFFHKIGIHMSNSIFKIRGKKRTNVRILRKNVVVTSCKTGERVT